MKWFLVRNEADAHKAANFVVQAERVVLGEQPSIGKFEWRLSEDGTHTAVSLDYGPEEYRKLRRAMLVLNIQAVMVENEKEVEAWVKRGELI